MVIPASMAFEPALIHLVESDDLYLQACEDVLWFELLRDLDWHPWRPIAAEYYEALWQSNEQAAEARRQREQTAPPNPETKEEATARLLFERTTLCPGKSILYEPTRPILVPSHVDPDSIGPGRTPPRLAGRQPKCFFAMFKAFVGVMVMGKTPEPETVYDELRNNPAFARTCGFTLPDDRAGYRQSDVPSLRKIEQFDQIMTEQGLWDKAAVHQVADNLQTERVQAEATAVHDTTHYHADSSFQSVPLSPPSADGSQDPATQTEARGGKKKSHPRTTKNCRCPNWDQCPHEWINADDGAGTVVKAGGKMHWAHKASTLGLPDQGVLLDAVAMTDAASHDSQSLPPHLRRLLERHPVLEGTIERVLDDGAADDADLKKTIQQEMHIEVMAPINPRNRQPITESLPRGIDRITPTGTPICEAGYPLDLAGCRRDTDRFIFRAPDDEQGHPVCQGCSLRPTCYRGDEGVRIVTIPFERLPFIDPEHPQLSRRFQKQMAKRTSIERIHKLMKYDYGSDRLTKRGNAAFQARLDKTLLAMHLVIAHQ